MNMKSAVQLPKFLCNHANTVSVISCVNTVSCTTEAQLRRMMCVQESRNYTIVCSTVCRGDVLCSLSHI